MGVRAPRSTIFGRVLFSVNDADFSVSFAALFQMHRRHMRMQIGASFSAPVFFFVLFSSVCALLVMRFHAIRKSINAHNDMQKMIGFFTHKHTHAHTPQNNNKNNDNKSNTIRACIEL